MCVSEYTNFNAPVQYVIYIILGSEGGDNMKQTVLKCKGESSKLMGCSDILINSHLLNGRFTREARQAPQG